MPRTKTPSSKLLVTGATGFLGKHLLEYLLQRGEKQVRVLTTSPPDWLQSLDVEIIEGSITSPEIVRVAVEGVHQIYHLAGRVTREEDEKRAMYAIHVDGTRILCEAAVTAGVRKIVMASSSGTIAITEDGFEIPNEDWPTPIEIISKFPYYASKLYQEKTARSICRDDIALVVLNPSLLLGPGDDRLSSTQDVLKFLSGEIPATPSGGINFVDVRDVAPAFYNAMQRGAAGERYLLGGPNWTLERFFGHLERISKVSAPRVKIPAKLHGVSSKLVEAAYKSFGKTPPVDPISMKMSRYYWYFDSTKAKGELGFRSRDPQETLYDTVEYLRSRFLGSGVFS
jgi:nucleoside-diphosphate-sugar epimerase